MAEFLLVPRLCLGTRCIRGTRLVFLPCLSTLRRIFASSFWEVGRLVWALRGRDSRIDYTYLFESVFWGLVCFRIT